MNIQLPQVNYDLLAFVHFIVCSVIGGVCICRLGRMHKFVRLRVKAQYILLLVISTASGLSPLFFQVWPNLLTVGMAVVVLFIIVSDSYQWKGGTPKSIDTRPASLEDGHAE